MERSVNLTYSGLRLGMVLLVVMLLTSVGAVIVAQGHWLESISAYYYTPARAVFVGALCAIGASLIIYRGSTAVENVLLDFAGFLSFVVAFVPTDFDEACAYCTGLASADVSAAITNNLIALLLTGAASIVAWLLVRGELDTDEEMTTSARISMVVSSIALVGAVVFFIINPDEVEASGHDVAAGFFFLFVFIVVSLNALGFQQSQPPDSQSLKRVAGNRYGLIAISMLVSAAVLFFLVRPRFDHWIFVLEALLIGEFAVFWIAQTLELGGQVARKA